MATAPRRQGWVFVTDEQKNDRDRSRTVRARQRAIGRELRRMFDDVIREPVPDDLLDVLRRIDSGRNGRENP